MLTVLHLSKTETLGSTTSDSMSVSGSGLIVCIAGIATGRSRFYSVLPNVQEQDFERPVVFQNVKWCRMGSRIATCRDNLSVPFLY